MLDSPADPRPTEPARRDLRTVTPELAAAIVLVAVMVVVAIIVRNVRDRSARAAGESGRPDRRTRCSHDGCGPGTAPAGRSPGTGWSHADRGRRGAGASRRGRRRAAAGVDDPEPPRVQLIRDASAVGIAIIVVLLIGPTIFASRTGAVLGETSPPDGAAVSSGELGPSPAAEAPPGSGTLDGEAIPSLVAPQPSPTPDPGVPATPGPRAAPNPGRASATPTPTPAKPPNTAPTPTKKPSPTPTKKPAPTPTPDPTPTPEPDPTPTPEPDPTPTPEPDPTPTPESPPPPP